MKKILIIIILLSPFIAIAQKTPISAGKFKINLANNRFYLSLANGNDVNATANCTTTGADCSTQIWELVPVADKPDTYHIILANSGKYLTWNGDRTITSRVILSAAYPLEKIKFQSFLITHNDKGTIMIQPALETKPNDYFLMAKLEAGDNNRVGIMNYNNVDWTTATYKNDWLFSPAPIAVTKLPISPPKPGVVHTPEPKTKVVLAPPKPSVVHTPPKSGKN
jgi:hypothetical protein